MFKKWVALVLCLLMAATLLAGCGNGTTANEKLNIVCTTFPQYDWVRQILGDRASEAKLTLLIDNGTDLHNYQPTAGDILTISNCDLFICVGGESDKWTDDVLKQSQNGNRAVLRLMELLGTAAKEEQLVDGMQAEDEHDHDDEHDEDEPEYDEHVWLSLRNAKLFCNKIAEVLCKLCPDSKEAITKNAANYVTKLSALDVQYNEAVNSAARKVLLVADRFPFRYLTEDYKLQYYAAFVGCSAETEASFSTITFLAQKIDALQLPVILVIDGSNKKLAESVIRNTTAKNQTILTLHSIQSVSKSDITNGATYLNYMEHNLTALKTALS